MIVAGQGQIAAFQGIAVDVFDGLGQSAMNQAAARRKQILACGHRDPLVSEGGLVARDLYDALCNQFLHRLCRRLLVETHGPHQDRIVDCLPHDGGIGHHLLGRRAQPALHKRYFIQQRPGQWRLCAGAKDIFVGKSQDRLANHPRVALAKLPNTQ